MIEKICNFLISKMRKQLPDIDDEKAEVLNYGLQLVIGEVPKIFLLILIAFLLGIGPLTLLTFLLILPYKMASGGFHLKTHLGCIIGTTSFYCGIVLLSKNIAIEPEMLKYAIITAVWLFGMLMCKLYAPADTENVPILSQKERKKKRIASYITLSITLIAAVIIKDSTISNILIFGTLFQSIIITKLAYRITNNKYGYEIYDC